MKRGKGDLVYYQSSPLLLSPAWLTELPDPVISGISDHEVPTASCRSFSPPASATFLPFAGLTRGTSRRHHYYHNKHIPDRISDTILCYEQWNALPRGMVPLRHPQKTSARVPRQLCLVPDSNLPLSRSQPGLGFTSGLLEPSRDTLFWPALP